MMSEKEKVELVNNFDWARKVQYKRKMAAAPKCTTITILMHWSFSSLDEI